MQGNLQDNTDGTCFLKLMLKDREIVVNFDIDGNGTGTLKWKEGPVREQAVASQVDKLVSDMCTNCEEADDCTFVSNSACSRRRAIRKKIAKCPLDLWDLDNMFVQADKIVSLIKNPPEAG